MYEFFAFFLKMFHFHNHFPSENCSDFGDLFVKVFNSLHADRVNFFQVPS